jgi:hypothetical protein
MLPPVAVSREALLRISNVCTFFGAVLAVALIASPALYANSSHSVESRRFAVITGGFSAYGISDLLPKGEGTGKASFLHPSAAFFGLGDSHDEAWDSNSPRSASFESNRHFSHVDFGKHRDGITIFPSMGTGLPAALATSDAPTTVPEPDAALLLVLGLGAAAVGIFALAKK